MNIYIDDEIVELWSDEKLYTINDEVGKRDEILYGKRGAEN